MEFKITTMNWYEAGPMISVIKGNINLKKAKEVLFSDDFIKETMQELINDEVIDDISEIGVSSFHIGPMKPEFDGEDALHKDEEGNTFWELCERDREGAEKVTGIDWQDWFV